MGKSFQEIAENIQERVRQVAYLMWESAGRQHGMALEYWLAAESDVLKTMQAAAESLMPREAKENPKPVTAVAPAPAEPPAAPVAEPPAAPAAEPVAAAPALAAQVEAAQSEATKPAAAKPAAKKADTAKPAPRKPGGRAKAKA